MVRNNIFVPNLTAKILDIIVILASEVLKLPLPAKNYSVWLVFLHSFTIKTIQLIAFLYFCKVNP